MKKYAVYVCPFCGNAVPFNGGHKHLEKHGVKARLGELPIETVYDVHLSRANRDKVRGLAVLINAYFTTPDGVKLLRGDNVLEELASLIRKNPRVFAELFIRVKPFATARVRLNEDVRIYVFKLSRYMTLYVGYDIKTNSIAMIEKNSDILYTKGPNADSLAKRVYDLITERREMWRRKWKQRSEKRQVVSNAAPPPPPNDTRITSTVAANTPTAAVPSRVGNSINNAGGDGSTSTAPGDLEKFVEELNANPWVDQIKKKAANTNTPAAAALDKPINNAGSSSLAMFERLVKEGGEEARKTFEKLVRGDFSGTRTSK